VGKGEMQTKAASLIEVLGDRGRDEALELVDVEVEGFGIGSLAGVYSA
jgi:hypothetical protein